MTTAADTAAADGACSLREAIVAANGNSNYFDCVGRGGGYDLIEFGLGAGTPVINIASELPTITGPVEINGAPNRVELHGPGADTGLRFSGVATAGSIVRNLVVNGFGAGILVDTAGNLFVAGSRIGTNADGTAAVANAVGIQVYSASATIGGTAGVTVGGPCTGDCNLISGNTLYGIVLQSGASAVVRGNFIGTNAAGLAVIGNGDGLRVLDISTATIGGTTTGAGNLVSGNATGIRIQVDGASPTGSLVQGNLLGTDVTGQSALPNGPGAAISVSLDNKNYPVTIGGATVGAGNLISGNTGVGIVMSLADAVTVHGNLIGTRADFTSLPNAGAGVQLSSSTHENLIGGTGAGQGNVIAYNATGVIVGINNYYNSIRGNSIHDNTGKGIELVDYQYNTVAPPILYGGQVILGSTCASCLVDVYSDDADEGRIYEGTVQADSLGDLTFGAPATGPRITATATISAGSTSEFSVAVPYDRDGDSVFDDFDNCTQVVNPDQLDADGDDYGNICDADFNNSNLTTAADFNLLRSVLNQGAGSSPLAAAADMNGSGTVTAADYGLLRARLNTAPGPSGLAP